MRPTDLLGDEFAALFAAIPTGNPLWDIVPPIAVVPFDEAEAMQASERA